MKKILQAFKKFFIKKDKETNEPIYYVCDPDKATECSKEGCWYLYHGPCKCTSKMSQAKTDEHGRCVVATAMDIWNEEFREYCLQNADIMKE